MHTFVAIALAALAATLPTLPQWQTTPSATFINQALAFALWPAFLLAVDLRAGLARPAVLLSALAAVLAAAAWSWLGGALPASLGLSAMATLAAAMVVGAGGAGMRSRPDAENLFAAFCWGWVACGVVNIVIALIQVFAPGWTDTLGIATPSHAGRAVGNLRQPNHLSSLLLWHAIAVIALLEMGRLRRGLAALLLALGVFCVVLTASRTGALSVVLLAVWALLDRRRFSRDGLRLVLAAPAMYGASWLAMNRWAQLSKQAFGGAERLAETDISSSRFAIWHNTLDLIAAHPWRGVGFGEFNFAWTLTPFPTRPTAFFDHSHNLVLQLLVELGLPLGGLVLLLLLWALGQAAWRAWRTPGALGTAQRCGVMMVVMIGVHSQLEYPLWYSYFLLPAAWVWGFALQGGPEAEAGVAAEPPRAASLAMVVAALLVVAGAAHAVVDYRRVVVIFSPAADSPSLDDRIVAGQRSVYFAHHADYAALTSNLPQPDEQRAFARATHYLLDTRLMMTWAQDLNRRGLRDPARHLAARLREFGKDDADELFAPCPAVALKARPGRPFQCELPQRVPDWREFAAN
ncbi:MAG: O-antigen ligase C-terminal domain-containing protein [Rubrivivax sp.]|nr:O-antigen ligase C-terminal domain-containing protein [Rubrivivax sp.]